MDRPSTATVREEVAMGTPGRPLWDLWVVVVAFIVLMVSAGCRGDLATTAPAPTLSAGRGGLRPDAADRHSRRDGWRRRAHVGQRLRIRPRRLDGRLPRSRWRAVRLLPPRRRLGPGGLALAGARRHEGGPGPWHSR